VEFRTNPTLAILLVSKDARLIDLIRQKLKAAEGWSLSVDQTQDGETALQKLGGAAFDLVFLDYELPGADGIDTLVQMRQLHEKTFVVMVTDKGSEAIAVAAMKQGAMDYLSLEEFKALDIRQLFRRLVEIRGLANQNMELRQINHMKNEFIANVSHELRTPLSVVLGFAKALQGGQVGPVNEDQKKALGSIIERAQELLNTLNQILKIRDAEEGKEQFYLKPVDLTAWLKNYSNKAPKGLAKKKMRLAVSIPDGAAWIRADEAKLADAIDNVVSNAVKFGPENTAIQLRLELIQGSARIAVTDEGPGVPPELLPHLFEKMFAAGQGPTRQYPGLGLGLALAQKIVTLHSGRIWLESKGPGLGTTAYVMFPLTAQDSPEVHIGHAPEVEKKKVLVVEDNPDLVEVLMLFMSTISPNLQVTTTNSGFAALESVKNEIPDLIILDVMMPGMSGLEVIERLRRTPETQRIPVLVLTGYSDGAQMALDRGAKDVLLKPFEKDRFIRKVTQLLQEPMAHA
jgi:two-component system, sensor histidine kinase ChiS